MACKRLKCSSHLESGRNLNGLGLILKNCLLLNQIATNWWSKIPSGTDDWPQIIGFKVFMKSHLFLQSKECKRTNKLRENIRKYVCRQWNLKWCFHLHEKPPKKPKDCLYIAIWILVLFSSTWLGFLQSVIWQNVAWSLERSLKVR